MKSIRIIENNSEIGAGTRGASLGIEALKVASLNISSDYFSKHEGSAIETENGLLFTENNTPSAIRVEGISRIYKRIADAVKTTLSKDQFPLVLAADHASAGGTIAGIKQHFPDKKLGVIWIDAHGDLHSPYTSPTGNVHGMPLATALNEDNISCKIKEVDDVAKFHWDNMKQLGGIVPKVDSENLIFYGVRDTEEPEEALMARLDIKNFTVKELRNLGVKEAAKQGLDLLRNCDIIYISFDVDSMDPELVSYGTGTPVADGFSPEEADELIQYLIQSKKVCCFEMVEINPTLDNKKNKMAEIAFAILENTTETIKKYALS